MSLKLKSKKKLPVNGSIDSDDPKPVIIHPSLRILRSNQHSLNFKIKLIFVFFLFIYRRTRSLNAPSPFQQFGPCGRIMKNSAMVM